MNQKFRKNDWPCEPKVDADWWLLAGAGACAVTWGKKQITYSFYTLWKYKNINKFPFKIYEPHPFQF